MNLLPARAQAMAARPHARHRVGRGRTCWWACGPSTSSGTTGGGHAVPERRRRWSSRSAPTRWCRSTSPARRSSRACRHAWCARPASTSRSRSIRPTSTFSTGRRRRGQDLNATNGGRPCNAEQLLKSTAAVSAATVLPAPAIAQAPRKISFLTWNIIDQEELIKGWITRFQSSRPGVEVEWLDKKGPELPPFYQTQLAAGTPPDVINTQGALGLEYAAQGALLDLTPRLADEAAVRARNSTPTTCRTGASTTRTTCSRSTSPRRCCSTTSRCSRRPGCPAAAELRRASRRGAEDDERRRERLSDPQLRLALLAALRHERRRPAHQGPEEAGLQHAEGGRVTERLARRRKSGAINKISWTGRWVEPNGAFAAGNVGMLHAHSPAYFFVKGQGSWVTPETLGVAHMPGGYATPNSPRPRHLQGLARTRSSPGTSSSSSRTRARPASSRRGASSSPATSPSTRSRSRSCRRAIRSCTPS